MRNLTFRSPKTEVRESSIHGKGLFAKVPINKGEIVAVKGGYILGHRQWAEIEPDLGSAEIQISEDLFIAPVRKEHREGGMLYSNHSCDPNIAIQGQIVLVAMKDIDANEELTHDWATTDDLNYEMQCNCGSPHCRGAITGKDWMRKDLQKKYKGWFCWFLQRKIDMLASENSLEQAR
ncbi:MAG: SET domain-containing protein-lysine N-methyltransferase [Desulfobacteraceae bacterium]